ncbi:MAG TPA: NUDIX domain-containing protein [Candidatus Paceibacterota bacterium]|nr:NUDIX domain-containing protein [Candidatus Paceibacterota bacterium]
MEERPKVGIGVLVLKEGRILLGERLASHGAGSWQIPGGHLEQGDTFEETALRELQEETGLTDAAVERMICVINDRVYGKHFVTIGMLLSWRSGEPYDAEPGKSRNWSWYLPEELPENMFLPSKNVIDCWRAGTIYTP